jgi:hypothetical protein
MVGDSRFPLERVLYALTFLTVQQACMLFAEQALNVPCAVHPPIVIPARRQGRILARAIVAQAMVTFPCGQLVRSHGDFVSARSALHLMHFQGDF